MTVVLIGGYKHGCWGFDPSCCGHPFAAVDCGVLDSPISGNVVVGTTTLGSVATYTCSSSFRLVGMDSRQCQENGTWSGEIPTCEGD